MRAMLRQARRCNTTTRGFMLIDGKLHIRRQRSEDESWNILVVQPLEEVEGNIRFGSNKQGSGFYTRWFTRMVFGPKRIIMSVQQRSSLSRLDHHRLSEITCQLSNMHQRLTEVMGYGGFAKQASLTNKLTELHMCTWSDGQSQQ